MYVVSLYLIAFHLYLIAYFFPPKADQPQADKPKLCSKIAFYCLGLGFLANLSLVIKHIFLTKRLPLTNISETMLSFVTLLVLIFLFLEFKRQLPKVTGLLVSLFSALTLYLALAFFHRPAMPLLPALQSKWMVFHVSSCIIAYAFFTGAFIVALTCLFKKDAAAKILVIAHRSICIGLLFLTLGIILGSIWGKSAWGHWWNWDPKEVWALITWLIYARYVHGRLFKDWPKKAVIKIAILGFLSCLFTYLGVSFLLPGLHSYG